MDNQKLREKFFMQGENELLENIPCGIYCTCCRTQEGFEYENLPMVFVNEEFYQCIGYTREEFEITGNDIRAIISRQDKETMNQQVKRAVSEPGSMVSQDYRICGPRGTVYHVLVAVRMAEGTAGYDFLLFACAGLDTVTEKTQMYEKQQSRTQEGLDKLNRMIRKLPAGCAVIQGTEHWELVSGNEEFFRAIGYTLEEIQVMPGDMCDILYKEDIERLKKAMEDVLHGDRIGQCEVRFCDKSGDIRWIALKIRLFYYEGRIPYFLVSSWDIHRRKRMEEELYLQTERHKLMEEINQEFPFEYDVKNRTIFISARSNIILADKSGNDYYAPRGVLERVLHREDCETFFQMIDRASQEEEHGILEYRVNIAKEGEKPEYAWHRSIYKSIRGVNGRIVRILGRTEDITRERLRQDEMAQRLKQDDLTGLLNKAATKAEIEEFLMSNPNGTHALFLIDVDNFKCVNDTLGHLFGDSVLVNVGKKIRGLFRGTDVIGRIGGDEFMVLMKYTDSFQARAKAQSICDVIKQTYHGRNQEEIEISCSVGVAMYGTIKESYTSLFSKADMAMYQAKEEGKNQYRVAEVVDPLWKVRKETRIEARSSHYKAGRVQDMDFLSEAFTLLSHAKDVNDSLNILMERIGRQYDLGRVAVLECDKEKHELIQTNCWTRESGILTEKQFMENKYEEWEGFMSGFDEWGLSYINDCFGDENVSEADRAVFRERKIRALVNCSFSYFDLGEGYVTFCDQEKPRFWTDYEKETFLELSRMLSVFVALRVQQEEDQKAIRRLKKRDLLTGLYIEDAFKSKVRKELKNWREDMEYAIVYTDINDFSYINENFGHEEGNEILKRFASQIRKGKNMISCRLYSDLFITFVWDKDRDTILQNIVKSSLDFSRRQKEIYTSCNIRLTTGIYFMEDKNENLDMAIENANLTRKSIKGNNSVFCQVYESRLRQQREEEKKVLSEFQSSLEEGRFQVYIQPKFLLSQFELSGGEALVRWKKKSGELISPGMFIPVLEKFGYIIELDFYVYEQVMIYMRSWKEAGKELPVISVNFSRSHFEKNGIFQRIMKLTEEYQIEPGCIEIEITESLFVSGIELVKMEVQQLRKAGFRVAIDDFGTGYSSLGMLLDIPADIVKIDRSFLNRENRQNEKEFIRNMGRLIRSVKGEIIFEGIETEEQREFLVNCGFRFGQGFLFDRPLPIEVFQEKYMK